MGFAVRVPVFLLSLLFFRGASPPTPFSPAPFYVDTRLGFTRGIGGSEETRLIDSSPLCVLVSWEAPG